MSTTEDSAAAGGAPAPRGTIRYWAAAREAAGIDQEELAAETVADLISTVAGRVDRPRLAEVLRICSFLVDGAPVGRRPPEDVRLRDGWVVEALPPFAGG